MESGEIAVREREAKMWEAERHPLTDGDKNDGRNDRNV